MMGKEEAFDAMGVMHANLTAQSSVGGQDSPAESHV